MSQQQIPNETKQGLLFALGAFSIWGLNPVYFKWLKHVNVYEIVASRILWMAVLLLIMLVVTKRTANLKPFITDKRMVGMMFFTALMVTINWIVFVWAVTHDQVLSASMGYFINPLFNVLLGMLFLRERLRPGQAISVAIAATGVIYMIIQHGRLPWVAIILPISFGTYGFLRKKIPIDSFNGLVLEMLALTPIALGYLMYMHTQSALSFTQEGLSTKGLLMGSGLVSLVPLMMFTAGVRRIPYSTVGIIQYTAPTMTFLLSIFLFKEELDKVQLVAFIFIWISLVVFTIEGVVYNRRMATNTTDLSEAAEGTS